MNACRLSPPAKYARKGAAARSDYAYPECWKYPIHTPEHVRAAASYFARFGHRIPPAERKRVAARIEQAKRRFGIGPYRDNPGAKTTMSTAKDAKIRGHRLALSNALSRGDQKAAKEQRAALRKLGASAPRGGGGKRPTGGMKKNPYAKRPTRSMKKNPSHSKVRVVKGYRRNPDDPLFDAAVKLREADEAAEKAAAEAAQKGTAEAAKKAEKAAEKAEKAAEKVEKVAEKVAKKPRKPAAKKPAARSKNMAKSKKGGKKSAKKAAGKKGSSRKGTPRRGTKAYYSMIGKKGAAARKRNARKASGGKSAARKPASSKGKGKGGKRRNRAYGLPEGFKKIDHKAITRGRNKKTGEIRTIVKYRKYKDNPLSDVSKIAMWGGGVVLGLVLSDMLRRFVATMAPKGAKKPFYGSPASERIIWAAPDAMQLGAQLGLGALLGGGAFLLRKKSPGATALLAGAAIGSAGLAILEMVNFYLMPKVFPAANISEEKFGNRLYTTEQKFAQDVVRDDIKKQNDALAAGKTVSPNDGSIAGARGLAGAPAHRALPPPARANAVAGAPQRGGTLAGAPSNSTGCPGGGCGGGCTGGRNCGCPKCAGMSQAMLPSGGSQLETFPGGGSFANPPAARGSETVARTVSGPRQLGQAQSPALFPSRGSQPRPRMALAR